MQRADPVRIVETAYCLQHDDGAWLSGIAEAAQSLSPGSGVYAFIYDLRGADQIPIKAAAEAGPMAGFDKGMESLRPLGPQLFRALFGPTPTVGLASRGLQFAPAMVRAAVTQLWNQEGIRDHIGVKAVNPSGDSVMLGFAIPLRKASMPSRRLDTLSRISAHLGAGLRLRRALQGFDAHPDDVATEAVLNPRGAMLHARTPAKEQESRAALARACRAIDHARGPMRKSEPDKAVAIWHGLVHGRWTLIDHHDSDGKRFLLARKNDPAARDPRALALRERQVLAFASLGHSNKMIAYELGLTPSTVAGHLRSVLNKMRVDSRRELIQLFGWKGP
jgi:DNA-binding CsgD family transcriptional regulator